MKRESLHVIASLLSMLAMLLVLCAVTGQCQTTQITASHIQLFGGQPVTGTFCVTPTDQSGNAINLVTPSGQQFAPQSSLCFPIVNGVLNSAAIVPDTALTQPANPCYKLTVYNTLNTQIANYPCIQPTSSTPGSPGSSWSFDAYVPTSLPSTTALTLPQFKTNNVLNPSQGALSINGPGVSYGAGGNVNISSSVSSVILYPAQCAASGAPSWCSGSTPDAYVRAACSALPSTGGALNFAGLTGNWAATIRGCTSPTKQVIIFSDPTSLISITETDGDIAIPLDEGSMFIGPGAAQCVYSTGGIHLTATANITAIVGPAHIDGSQEAFVAAGLCLFGFPGMTVSQGLVYTDHNYAGTTIENNTVGVCGTACIKVHDGSAQQITNNWLNVADSSSGFTGSGLIIQGSGGGTGCNVGPLYVSGGQIEHALGGGPEILIEGDGAGAQACGVNVMNVGVERNNAGTPSSVGIQVTDCLGCTVNNVWSSGPSSGATDLVNVSQTASGRTQNVTLSNISDTGTYPNTVHDTIASVALAESSQPQVTVYYAAPGYLPASSGTVTGVTATAPIQSSGGTAPVISIAALTQTQAEALFASLTGCASSSYLLAPAGGTCVAPATGSVTTVSVTSAAGVSGSVATSTTTPAITITLGAIAPTSVNALTLLANSTGWQISGGTTSKTFTLQNSLSFAGTDATTMTFPSASGTVLTASSTATVTNKSIQYDQLTAGTGTKPTTTGSSCGTTGTITGGMFHGKVATATVTSCTLQLNFSYTAPDGYNCRFWDATTAADYFQSSVVNTTSSCTSGAMTIVAGDSIGYQADPI